MAYAWVMGYLNFTSEKTGKAIQIQSTALVPTSAPNVYTLYVYVQNVGQGSIILDHASSVYINSQLLQLSSGDFAGGATTSEGKTTLNPGATVAIHTHFTVETSGTTVKVKIATTEGSFQKAQLRQPWEQRPANLEMRYRYKKLLWFKREHQIHIH